MKKLVQRFALLALMLLPMLASATVTNAVPTPAARGSVTIGNAQGGALFDTVYANPNPGYKVSKWLNGSAELSEIPGEVVFDGNKILLDATQTWDITCVFGSESYTVSKSGSLVHGDITGDLGEWPYGKLIHLMATPESGYQFDSWADDATAPADRYVHVTGNIELSATFVPATYSLILSTNADDISIQVKRTNGAVTYFDNTYDIANGDIIPALDVAYGDKIALRVFTAASGAHFDVPITWTPSNDVATTTPTKTYTILSFPASDVTLDIQLTPADVIIAATSILDELGTVSGAGTVGYGDAVSLSANPETGYVFDHWVNAETGTSYTTNPLEFTATTDSTFTAYFEPERYPIALAADPLDAATFTVKNLTLGTDAVAYNPLDDYPNGTGLQITAVPAPHFQFDKWSDESTLNPRTDYVWNASSVNLTALFVPDTHTVTVVSDAKGTPTPSGVCEHVAHDSVFNVTVVAANEDEYVFDHWEDANGNTVTLPITVVSDTTITAVYLPVVYTIAAVINAGDEAKGTISPASQTVNFGETATLTATPNTGYNFKKWSETEHYGDSTNAVIHPTIDVSNASHTYEWTASFGTDEFKVTVASVDAAYGITLDPSGIEYVSYGNTITVAEDVNTNPTMYYVAGFTDNHDNVLTMPLTVTQDTTVIAVIDSVEYDLTLTSATIDGKSDTVLKYNTTFTLTPDAPADGKTFKSWTVDGVADVSTDPAYEFTMNDDDMEIEAVYEDVTYTVTVVADPTEGGDVTGTATGVAHGASVTITAAAKAHYTFIGWNDGNNNESRNITVVSDTTFTASFAAESYTITLQANDPVMGTVEFDDPAHATVEYNTVIRPYLVAHPNPDGGYYLKCWLDQNGDTIDGNYHIASNVTATAIFGYSDMDVVVYAAEYGDTASHQDSWGSIAVGGVLAYTGEVTLTPSANAHYTFKGWSDGVNDNPRTFILTRDTLFYAFFAPDTHTVTITVNDENMGSVTGFTGTKAAYGSTINVTAEANTAAHYHFIKWSDNTTDAAHAAITVVSDTALQAIFGIDSVTITAANTDGFGTYTPAAAVTLGYGSTVELEATANHGYKFLNWSNGVTTVTTTPYTVTAGTADETWTVSFELDQFTVTTVATPAHAATALTGAGDYDYMEDVTLGYTAATGYEFVEWQDADGNTVTATFTLTDDTTVYAVFDSVTVGITAVSNNDLWGTVTATPTSVKYNQTVDLEAKPSDGYELVSWNDGTTTFAAASNDTTFKVLSTTPMTYTATFGPGTFAVNAAVADTCTGMGTVSGSASALYGEDVTLHAVANEGYHFVNWNGDALLTNPDQDFPVGIADTTHVAVFAPNTYTLTIACNFDVRGHVEEAGATVASKTVSYGTTVTLDAVSHAGYDFEKWIKIDGTELENDTHLVFTYNVAANATVTANFKYHQWTVAVSGTNGATVTGDGTYNNGEEVTVTAAPAAHYTQWKGWKNELDEVVSNLTSYTFSVVSDVTLTAVYDVDTHAVAFTVLPAASYGTITNGVDSNYAYGSQIELTAVPNDPLHYSFVEWEDGSADVNRTVTVEGDTTFTATFEADKYQFTVSSDNTTMGTVTGTASGSYDYNTAISVNVTPNTGYHFVKWVDANTGDSITDALPYAFNIDRDTAIKAVFTNDLYTLTLTTPVKEMGWLAIDGDSAGYMAAGSIVRQVPSHTDIELTAMPNYGYNFGAWSDDATADSVRTIQVTGDLSLTATFGYNTYEITLAANDDARGTVVFNGTYNNNYGAKDTIQANPNAGFQFLHWAEDNATTNPRPIIVSENATYTAVFGYLPQTVTSNECDSVVWMNGTETVGTYYTSTSVTETFEDIYGLDSVVTNNITVRHSTTGIDVQTSCYTDYTWINGTTYSESNNTDEYLLAGANAEGCDSLVTLNFTYFENLSKDTVVEACNPFTWDYTGLTYDTEGDHVTGPFADVNGCDSTTSLHLTFTTPKDTVLTTTACDEFVWTIAGTDHVYTTTGDDSFVFTDVNQCTATATIHVTINNSTVGTDVQDECDSYTWIDNVTYTEDNNTATKVLTNAVGCDSTVTLDLTIRHSTTYTDVQDECDTYTWINGETYTASNNTATHTITNLAGCDSVITLDLTIRTSTAYTDVQVACDEYTWIDDVNYTASNNTATFLTTNAAGCDSVITLDLTVNHSNTGVDTQDECDSYTWINGITYTESNNTDTYVLTNANAVGCDSTVTLNLTIRNKVNEDVYAEACDSYEWNGLPFTESGNVTINSNGGAANGCDSITTLHLTIQHTSVVTLDPVAVCDEYTWEYNGITIDTYTTSGNKVYEYAEGLCEHNTATLPLTINTLADVEETAAACDTYTWTISSTGETFTYTEGGDKTETITDANGCTATAILHLTINDSPEIEQTAEACSSYDWTIMGHEYHYTTGGDKVETFTDANSCTVTATLHLTIHTPETGVNTAATICEGATYTWNEVAYDEAGTYYYDYTDANNCAVQDTLVLSVNAVVPGTNTAEAICEGATYTWNNTVYDAAGTYYYDYTDGNNCPVQDTLVLTVNIPEAGTNTAEAICEGTTYTWNNTVYDAAGTYYYDYTDANGCAIQDTLVLTVNIPAAGTNTAEAICEGDSYTWNNTPYTAAGTYYYDYTDANGCAVQDTLVLTVNTPAAGTTTNEAICAGQTYTWNNQPYTTAGTYTQNTADANGCTVTNTLTLTVNPAQNVTLPAVTACDSYTFNGTAYTASQVITVTNTDVNGCDSTTTLNLTVNQSVTSAVALSDTGSVVYNGVTYTADTVVTVTYTAANDCDSIVTATITVINEVVAPDSIFVYIGTTFPAHGTVTPSTYTNYAIGDTIVATAAADSGYQFLHWVIGRLTSTETLFDTVTVNPISYVLTADDTNYAMMTFMAEFESISGAVDSMTIILATADATMGTTNPVPGTYRVAEGDSIIISAVANPGYQHLYWIRETQYTNGTDAYVDTLFGATRQINVQTWLLETTATYTAYFEVDTNYVPDTNTYYHVTILNADTTMGTVAESDSVIAGYPFTAYAIAFEGYNFTAWTGVAGDTISVMNPYIFVPTEDVTLIANFAVDSTPVIDTVYYNVTINYDATMGSVTGEGRYLENTVVTVRATAANGYEFKGWVKNGDTVARTNEYTFMLTADVTLTAAFAAVPVYYTVTGMPNDPNMGTVSGSGPYEAGATATLTATPNSGYHFVNWSTGETTNIITFTVTEDVTVIAYFEPDQQGIDETDMENVTIYSAETRIIVSGAEGKTVNVYDINGRTVSTMTAAAETVEMRMPATGVYLVKVGNAPAKRVLVVR